MKNKTVNENYQHYLKLAQSKIIKILILKIYQYYEWNSSI